MQLEKIVSAPGVVLQSAGIGPRMMGDSFAMLAFIEGMA